MKNATKKLLKTIWFEEGFIPERKSNTNWSRAGEPTKKLHGESEQEESLSEPRCHKRQRMTSKETRDKKENTATPETIKDARETIKKATERKKSIIISKKNLFTLTLHAKQNLDKKRKWQQNKTTTKIAPLKQNSSTNCNQLHKPNNQTKNFTHKQSELSIEVYEIYEFCVRRVDPTMAKQEETDPM